MGILIDMPLASISWREFILWIVRRRRRVVVTNGSMLPTLKPGDEILYQPAISKSFNLTPGDIVIVDHPNQPGNRLIKRVVQIDAQGYMDIRGDNSAASSDSRHFGQVPSDRVIGKATCLFSPGND